MKYLNSFTVIFLSAIIFISCSGSSATNTTADSAATASANTTSSDPDASFSCMLDGKEFSGKGTDQNINAAFHLTGDNKGQIFFRLSNMDDPGNKLMFQVAAKTGSTTFSISPTYSYGGYTTADFATYIDDPITVTITSISSTRVTGAFSGKYTLQKGSGNNSSKQTIEVTDGKFDIPFSTSAEWKQMYHAE
ncbi:MAG: hypothetical protein ACHQF0_05550 [Chitinophagales bacterium]